MWILRKELLWVRIKYPGQLMPSSRARQDFGEATTICCCFLLRCLIIADGDLNDLVDIDVLARICVVSVT